MLEPRRKQPTEDGMRIWLLVGAVAVAAITAYAELIVDIRTPTPIAITPFARSW